MNWMRWNGQPGHGRQRPGHERLGHAGQVVEQHVAVGQQPGQDQLEDRPLADDGPLDLVEDRLGPGRGLLEAQLAGGAGAGAHSCLQLRDQPAAVERLAGCPLPRRPSTAAVAGPSSARPRDRPARRRRPSRRGGGSSRWRTTSRHGAVERPGGEPGAIGVAIALDVARQPGQVGGHHGRGRPWPASGRRARRRRGACGARRRCTRPTATSVARASSATRSVVARWAGSATTAIAAATRMRAAALRYDLIPRSP